MKDSLEQKRERFFRHRCRELRVEQQDLYHGSPLYGLEQIRRCRRIEPQVHGILPGEWFCVSINDNMLRFFSDEPGMTGMVFDRPSLRVIQLDELFFGLATTEESGQMWLDRLSEEEQAWVYRLGYVDSRDNPYMSEGQFRALIPEWADGVVFPGWSPFVNAHNAECEIALNQRGCDKLWRSLETLVIRDRWHGVRYGWRKVKRMLGDLEPPELWGCGA